MTGIQLDEELLRVGLLRQRLFVVNATCCLPPINKTENQMRRATVCCRPVLLNQLSKFPADTHVLAMGKWAAFALTLKDKGVMNARGFVRPFTIPRPIASMDDASELLRGENESGHRDGDVEGGE
jgi:uracil-DNA glycosylase